MKRPIQRKRLTRLLNALLMTSARGIRLTMAFWLITAFGFPTACDRGSQELAAGNGAASSSRSHALRPVNAGMEDSPVRAELESTLAAAAPQRQQIPAEPERPHRITFAVRPGPPTEMPLPTGETVKLYVRSKGANRGRVVIQQPPGYATFRHRSLQPGAVWTYTLYKMMKIFPRKRAGEEGYERRVDEGVYFFPLAEIEKFVESSRLSQEVLEQLYGQKAISLDAQQNFTRGTLSVEDLVRTASRPLDVATALGKQLSPEQLRANARYVFWELERHFSKGSDVLEFVTIEMHYRDDTPAAGLEEPEQWLRNLEKGTAQQRRSAAIEIEKIWEADKEGFLKKWERHSEQLIRVLAGNLKDPYWDVRLTAERLLTALASHALFHASLQEHGVLLQRLGFPEGLGWEGLTRFGRFWGRLQRMEGYGRLSLRNRAWLRWRTLKGGDLQEPERLLSHLLRREALERTLGFPSVGAELHLRLKGDAEADSLSAVAVNLASGVGSHALNPVHLETPDQLDVRLLPAYPNDFSLLLGALLSSEPFQRRGSIGAHYSLGVDLKEEMALLALAFFYGDPAYAPLLPEPGEQGPGFPGVWTYRGQTLDLQTGQVTQTHQSNLHIRPLRVFELRSIGGGETMLQPADLFPSDLKRLAWLAVGTQAAPESPARKVFSAFRAGWEQWLGALGDPRLPERVQAAERGIASHSGAGVSQELDTASRAIYTALYGVTPEEVAGREDSQPTAEERRRANNKRQGLVDLLNRTIDGIRSVQIPGGAAVQKALETYEQAQTPVELDAAYRDALSVLRSAVFSAEVDPAGQGQLLMILEALEDPPAPAIRAVVLPPAAGPATNPRRAGLEELAAQVQNEIREVIEGRQVIPFSDYPDFIVVSDQQRQFDEYLLGVVRRMGAEELTEAIGDLLVWMEGPLGMQDLLDVWIQPKNHERFLVAVIQLVSLRRTRPSVSAQVENLIFRGLLSKEFLQVSFEIDPIVFDNVISHSGMASSDAELHTFSVFIDNAPPARRPALRVMYQILQADLLAEVPSLRAEQQETAGNLPRTLPVTAQRVFSALGAVGDAQTRFWTERIDPAIWRNNPEVGEMARWVSDRSFPLKAKNLSQLFSDFADRGLRAILFWDPYDTTGPEVIAALQELLKPETREAVERDLFAPDDEGEARRNSVQIELSAKRRVPGIQLPVWKGVPRNPYGDILFYRSLPADYRQQFSSYRDYLEALYAARLAFYQSHRNEVAPPAAGLEETFSDPERVLPSREEGEQAALRYLQQSNSPVMLVFGDVDWLGLMNRLYSKPVVNPILAQLFGILKREVDQRKGMIYRHGEDEFILLLPLKGTTDSGPSLQAQAEQELVRIRETVAAEMRSRYKIVRGPSEPETPVPEIARPYLRTQHLYAGRQVYLLEIPSDQRSRPVGILEGLQAAGFEPEAEFPITVSLSGQGNSSPQEVTPESYEQLRFRAGDWLVEAKKHSAWKNVSLVGSEIRGLPHRHRGSSLLQIPPRIVEGTDIRLPDYSSEKIRRTIGQDLRAGRPGILLELVPRYRWANGTPTSATDANGDSRFKAINELSYRAGDDMIKLLLKSASEAFSPITPESSVTVARAPPVSSADSIWIWIRFSKEGYPALDDTEAWRKISRMVDRRVYQVQAAASKILRRETTPEFRDYGIQVQMNWAGASAERATEEEFRNLFSRLNQALIVVRDQQRAPSRWEQIGFLLDPPEERALPPTFLIEAQRRVEQRVLQDALAEAAPIFGYSNDSSTSPAAGLEENQEPTIVSPSQVAGFDVAGADTLELQRENVQALLAFLGVDPQEFVVNVGSGVRPLIFGDSSRRKPLNLDTQLFARQAADQIGAEYADADVIQISGAVQPSRTDTLPEVLLFYRMGSFVDIYHGQNPQEFWQAAWKLVRPGGWILLVNPPFPEFPSQALSYSYQQILSSLPAGEKPSEVRVVTPDGTLPNALTIAIRKPAAGLEESPKLIVRRRFKPAATAAEALAIYHPFEETVLIPRLNGGATPAILLGIQEAAINLMEHGGGGDLEVFLSSSKNGVPPRLTIRLENRGPGLIDPNEILRESAAVHAGVRQGPYEEPRGYGWKNIVAPAVAVTVEANRVKRRLVRDPSQNLRFEWEGPSEVGLHEGVITVVYEMKPTAGLEERGEVLKQVREQLGALKATIQQRQQELQKPFREPSDEVPMSPQLRQGLDQVTDQFLLSFRGDPPVLVSLGVLQTFLTSSEKTALVGFRLDQPAIQRELKIGNYLLYLNRALSRRMDKPGQNLPAVWSNWLSALSADLGGEFLVLFGSPISTQAPRSPKSVADLSAAVFPGVQGQVPDQAYVRKFVVVLLELLEGRRSRVVQELGENQAQVEALQQWVTSLPEQTVPPAVGLEEDQPVSVVYVGRSERVLDHRGRVAVPSEWRPSPITWLRGQMKGEKDGFRYIRFEPVPAPAEDSPGIFRIDAQGRIRLTRDLLDWVGSGTGDQVVWLGVSDHLELWNQEAWSRFEALQQQQPLVSVKTAGLEEPEWMAQMRDLLRPLYGDRTEQLSHGDLRILRRAGTVEELQNILGALNIALGGRTEESPVPVQEMLIPWQIQSAGLLYQNLPFDPQQPGVTLQNYLRAMPPLVAEKMLALLKSSDLEKIGELKEAILSYIQTAEEDDEWALRLAAFVEPNLSDELRAQIRREGVEILSAVDPRRAPADVEGAVDSWMDRTIAPNLDEMVRWIDAEPNGRADPEQTLALLVNGIANRFVGVYFQYKPKGGPPWIVLSRKRVPSDAALLAKARHELMHRALVEVGLRGQRLPSDQLLISAEDWLAMIAGLAFFDPEGLDSEAELHPTILRWLKEKGRHLAAENTAAWLPQISRFVGWMPRYWQPYAIGAVNAGVAETLAEEVMPDGAEADKRRLALEFVGRFAQHSDGPITLNDLGPAARAFRAEHGLPKESAAGVEEVRSAVPFPAGLDPSAQQEIHSQIRELSRAQGPRLHLNQTVFNFQLRLNPNPDIAKHARVFSPDEQGLFDRLVKDAGGNPRSEADRDALLKYVFQAYVVPAGLEERRVVVFGQGLGRRFSGLRMLAEQKPQVIVDGGDPSDTLTRAIQLGDVIHFYGGLEEGRVFKTLIDASGIQVPFLQRDPANPSDQRLLWQILAGLGIPADIISAGLEEFYQSLELGVAA